MTLLLLITLTCIPVSAKEKNPKNAQDPYATAESETPPPVNAADLAYRTILFDDFVVPAEYERDARRIVDATEIGAINRLDATHAFATVAKRQTPLPQEPYFLVKCTLLNYRIVSKKARFFGGAFAGRSYITYRVDVYDQSQTLQFQREITTENNPIAAAWSFNDKNLPTFLGNVLADYLALRARKDMGASALPLTDKKTTSTPQPATPSSTTDKPNP
jgi:hypothetical protein